jgi:hypothetical protein
VRDQVVAHYVNVPLDVLGVIAMPHSPKPLAAGGPARSRRRPERMLLISHLTK